MLDPTAHAMGPDRITPRRFVLGHRAHAGARGPLWSAISVALAAAGCAPPGPMAPESATVSMRAELAVGAPLFDMAGAYGGKGDPIAPPPAGAPVSGQPIPAGPAG